MPHFETRCLFFQAEKSGETPEKEQLELEEKDDSTQEKDKKKKKEKKAKKPKGPSKIEVLSAGLDLNERDEKAINTEIDVS